MTTSRQSEVSITVYYYIDTSYSHPTVQASNTNWWYNRDKLPVRGQLGKEAWSSNFFFLESRSITLDISDYDPILAKIDSLESILQKDLADSHVRQQKLKDQIAELKCIGHDNGSTDWEPLPDLELMPNGGIPVPSSFDDDILF